MRILLSSLCLFLWVGCASYPKTQGFESIASVSKETLNPYFSNPEKDYVYKAKIDAFNRSFGGILIIKKLGDEHHRIVFTTEIGNTLFDFEFQDENFKINHILPEIDKKLLTNILKRDFLALIHENPTRGDSYKKSGEMMVESILLSKKHYYVFENEGLEKISRTAKGKEKVTFLFYGINDNIARQIEIEHKNIDLKIALMAI